MPSTWLCTHTAGLHQVGVLSTHTHIHSKAPSSGYWRAIEASVWKIYVYCFIARLKHRCNCSQRHCIATYNGCFHILLFPYPYCCCNIVVIAYITTNISQRWTNTACCFAAVPLALASADCRCHSAVLLLWNSLLWRFSGTAVVFMSPLCRRLC